VQKSQLLGIDLPTVGKPGKGLKMPGNPMGWQASDRRSFGAVLKWHLVRGTRPGGNVDRPGRKWSQKEFADAVGVNYRTVTYWLKDEHLPMEIETVERLLFGSDTSYDAWRLELRNTHVANFSNQPADIEAQSTERAPRVFIDEPPIASNIPFAVPMHFLGRDDLFLAIDERFSHHARPVAVTALHGMHGVGKTTLAAAYAERARDKYQATWWIRAHSESTIRSDLVALGMRLGWVGTNDKEDQALARVMEHLRHVKKGILLIYDNAVSAAKLKSYLPRGGCIQALITSNSHNWRGVAETIETPLWSKQIGADYLVLRTGRHAERDQAEALSDLLGGLPLAHEQAAAYCERLEISLREYRARFEARPVPFLDDVRDTPTDHNDGMTVAKSFTLAIEEAAKLDSAIEPLIMYVAILPPEPIPLFFFSEARQTFGEPLATNLAAENFDEVISILRSFAILYRETIVDEANPRVTTESIRLHRLVREVVLWRCRSKYSLPKVEEAQSKLIEALAFVYPKDVFDDPNTWPRARRLDYHGRAMISQLSEVPTGTESATSQLLDRLASYSHGALASYDLAQPLFERALTIRQQTNGPKDQLTASSLNNLGRLYWDQGKLSEARTMFERALTVREEVFGPGHPKTAASLNNLGSLVQVLGDFQISRSNFERALSIREEVLGPDHADTAASLTNLARVMRDQKQFAAGEPYARRALAVRERILGCEHPRTAASLNVLAQLLVGQGKLSEAKPLFDRALAICEKVLGTEHPYTATTLNNVALLLHAAGDRAAARAHFGRSLAIREKMVGPEHPSTATSLHGLACLLRDEGEMAEAERLYEQTLSIRENSIGSTHPDTELVRGQLSMLRSKLN
jgi:tetratricopeptide (TPR) repeat protein/transcriptional regulator with XRE-family HTH domain